MQRKIKDKIEYLPDEKKIICKLKMAMRRMIFILHLQIRTKWKDRRKLST
jgi:hypothetical protein